MTDVNEIRALKASFRGMLETGSQLAAIQDSVQSLDDHADIDKALLDDLARLASAHAVASSALRGLVDTMQTRRGASTSA